MLGVNHQLSLIHYRHPSYITSLSLSLRNNNKYHQTIIMVLQKQQQKQQHIEESSSSSYNSSNINNNIVAQSEYQAALAAIESTFDNFHQFQQEGQDKHCYPDLDHEMIEGIYEAAKKSLLNNVERIVRPINDNKYSDYIDQYHIVLDEEDDYDDDEEESKEKNNSDDDDHEEEEEEEEIDEEELVDTKAWKNAQELRTRIRNMSGTVQDIRERVLKSTEDGISSSFSAHLIDKPIKIVFEGDDNKEDGHDASNNDKENSINNSSSNSKDVNSKRSKDDTYSDCISSSSLQDSLEGLSRLLQDPQWTRLPNRIQSLQDTIETIQKETTEDRFVSQTEIAITSQQCKGSIVDESSRKLLEGNYGEEEESNIDAMDRLALLGQMFS